MARHIVVVLIAALLALALTLAMLPALVSAAPAPPITEPATAAARAALDAGALLFNAKDAPGLAATYLDDATLTVVGRDPAAQVVRREVKQGRSAIEAYYRAIFRGEGTFHARNTVEFARFAGPELLLITGHFVLDTTKKPTITLPFVQVRQKVGDAWRIQAIEVFVVKE